MFIFFTATFVNFFTLMKVFQLSCAACIPVNNTVKAQFKFISPVNCKPNYFTNEMLLVSMFLVCLLFLKRARQEQLNQLLGKQNIAAE